MNTTAITRQLCAISGMAYLDQSTKVEGNEDYNYWLNKLNTPTTGYKVVGRFSSLLGLHHAILLTCGNTLVVGFSGTETTTGTWPEVGQLIADVILDFDAFQLKPYLYPPTALNGGTVHMGFYLSLLSILNLDHDYSKSDDNDIFNDPKIGFLVPAFEGSALLNAIQKFDGIDEIYFTGHSQGGAMAALAAPLYKMIHPKTTVKLYTYGSPRAGNIGFSLGCNLWLDESIRIKNQWDPVSHLPPAINESSRLGYILMKCKNWHNDTIEKLSLSNSAPINYNTEKEALSALSQIINNNSKENESGYEENVIVGAYEYIQESNSGIATFIEKFITHLINKFVQPEQDFFRKAFDVIFKLFARHYNFSPKEEKETLLFLSALALSNYKTVLNAVKSLENILPIDIVKHALPDQISENLNATANAYLNDLNDPELFKDYIKNAKNEDSFDLDIASIIDKLFGLNFDEPFYKNVLSEGKYFGMINYAHTGTLETLAGGFSQFLVAHSLTEYWKRLNS